MEYRILGRTGLHASIVGLGGGGRSCLGLRQGRTEKEAIRLVHQAIDAGVNLLDTSERNGTESVLSAALKGRDRSRVILSSKRRVSIGDHRVSASGFAASIDQCLSELGTDCIDIFSFHGVFPEEYDYVVQELLPVLERARSAGKVRFCGITEAFKRDTRHRMLQRAVADDHWDVVMVGYNFLNFSAREILAHAARNGNPGVLGMFAVRHALQNRSSLATVINHLKGSGQLPREVDGERFAALLLESENGATDMTELAYRFCVTDSPLHCVLTGTGRPSHLERNLAAFGKPPLSQTTMELIEQVFSGLDTVSGDVEDQR